MKPSTLLLALAALFVTSSLQAEDKGEVLRMVVPDMSCTVCTSTITQALGELDGVGEVAISLKSKVALVQVAAGAEDSAIKAAVKEAGYKPTKVKRINRDWEKAVKNIDKTKDS